MPSLRLRLIGLFVLLSVAVALVMFLAVQRFGAEQIMKLAMEGGSSEAEARAMFDQYVGAVLLIWALCRREISPEHDEAAGTVGAS